MQPRRTRRPWGLADTCPIDGARNQRLQQEFLLKGAPWPPMPTGPHHHDQNRPPHRPAGRRRHRHPRGPRARRRTPSRAAARLVNFQVSPLKKQLHARGLEAEAPFEQPVEQCDAGVEGQAEGEVDGEGEGDVAGLGLLGSHSLSRSAAGAEGLRILTSSTSFLHTSTGSFWGALGAAHAAAGEATSRARATDADAAALRITELPLHRPAPYRIVPRSCRSHAEGSRRQPPYG